MFALLGILPLSGFAEKSLDFGNYTVYFNAFRSDSLTPEIAKAYLVDATQQPHGC